jgi:hypothetical protein
MMETDPVSKKLKAIDNVQNNSYAYCNSYGARRAVLRSGPSISIPLSACFPMFSSSYIAILSARILVMVKTAVIH